MSPPQSLLLPPPSLQICRQADGFQPHLVSPERGIKRLVQEAMMLTSPHVHRFVDEIHLVLTETVSAEGLRGLGSQGIGCRRSNEGRRKGGRQVQEEQQKQAWEGLLAALLNCLHGCLSCPAPAPPCCRCARLPAALC